jgi:hypothetical protein
MSHQNEEEFDMEEYVPVPVKAVAAKKPKLSAKHESLMVFGFWFVQQLGLDGEDKERAYDLLKLKNFDVQEQTAFYGSFTDKAAIRKAELREFVKVPKVRKPRAPRKPKVPAASMEIVEMAQNPKNAAAAPKKRKAKAGPSTESPAEEEPIEPVKKTRAKAKAKATEEPPAEEPMVEAVFEDEEFHPMDPMDDDHVQEVEEEVEEEVEPVVARKRGRKPNTEAKEAKDEKKRVVRSKAKK